MLTLINTAKTFTNEQTPAHFSMTEPAFALETDILLSELKRHSVADLEKLMKTSAAIAELNYNRYLNWSNCQRMPALQAFNGEIYKKLKEEALTPKNWVFAQKTMLIISGLYGLLRPMDGICPYRLEMYTKLSVAGKKNLYDYWRDLITAEINTALKLSKSTHLVNLASNEYFSVFDRKKITCSVIDVFFQEKTKTGFKIVAIYAKHARGRMMRYIIDRKITEVEKLKLFNLDGYSFNPEFSNDEKYHFTRG